MNSVPRVDSPRHAPWNSMDFNRPINRMITNGGMPASQPPLQPVRSLIHWFIDRSHLSSFHPSRLLLLVFPSLIQAVWSIWMTCEWPSYLLPTRRPKNWPALLPRILSTDLLLQSLHSPLVIHSFNVGSLYHLFLIHSLLKNHSLIHSLSHSLTHSWQIIHSLIHTERITYRRGPERGEGKEESRNLSSYAHRPAFQRWRAPFVKFELLLPIRTFFYHYCNQ